MVHMSSYYLGKIEENVLLLTIHIKNEKSSGPVLNTRHTLDWQFHDSNDKYLIYTDNIISFLLKPKYYFRGSTYSCDP